MNTWTKATVFVTFCFFIAAVLLQLWRCLFSIIFCAEVYEGRGYGKSRGEKKLELKHVNRTFSKSVRLRHAATVLHTVTNAVVVFTSSEATPHKLAWCSVVCGRKLAKPAVRGQIMCSRLSQRLPTLCSSIVWGNIGLIIYVLARREFGNVSAL